MSNLGMLYCHSVPDSRFTVSNEVVGIEVGIWYYYHRYLINDCWFIDLKKADSRFCDTILCFREEDMSSWFWDRVQFRDRRIVEILEGLGE